MSYFRERVKHHTKRLGEQGTPGGGPLVTVRTFEDAKSIAISFKQNGIKFQSFVLPGGANEFFVNDPAQEREAREILKVLSIPVESKHHEQTGFGGIPREFVRVFDQFGFTLASPEEQDEVTPPGVLYKEKQFGELEVIVKPNGRWQLLDADPRGGALLARGQTVAELTRALEEHS